MIARPKCSTRLFWNGTSLWLLLCSSTFLNILTSCRYTFKWVIKWYHSISLIFTFTTLLRIKTIFGDPEPWSQLDSSLWGSKNLLLCSECQAKWRCCLGGLDGKGYWNPLALRHWSIIARPAGRQQHRNNVAANTPSAYWKRAMYLPFLDHLVTEINEKLVVPLPGFQAQLLIPGKWYCIGYKNFVDHVHLTTQWFST